MSEENTLNNGLKLKRSSNIELFRIITMFLILLAHFSEFYLKKYSASIGNLSITYILLLSIGVWGKFGINCFVLITGYFMCKSKITLKKYLILFLEVEFYAFIMKLFAVLLKLEPFSIKSFIYRLIPFNGFGRGFTPSYLVFFLFIPFLNVLVRNINKKQHIYLIVLSLFFFSFIYSIPKLDFNIGYITWFSVLYFIASYIRFYPNAFTDSKKKTGLICLGLFLISVLSIIVIHYLNVKKGLTISPNYFVVDSQKILGAFTAIFFFMFFKNINVKQSKIINAFGGSSYGVLLIHTSSTSFMYYLFSIICFNGKFADKLWSVPILLAVLILVYIAFSIIDMLRKRFLEKTLFNLLDKKFLKRSDEKLYDYFTTE